jgi:UDP-N-acetylglucosamine--N-acetylmuramyl-(pentapeptide) pyrophosphoryl-undecaprenol N-acetylglucosamine transferase
LFPGLAVAEQLRGLVPTCRVTFAGSGKDFERRHVEQAGHDYLPLSCRPRGRGPWSAVKFLAHNLAGYRAAASFFKRQPVSAVVGLGGYVSLPMARAAVGRGIPLVLLEQNAVPGRVNRWLAPHAHLICLSFPESRPWLQPAGPVRVTGNPVRRGFQNSRHTPCAVRLVSRSSADDRLPLSAEAADGTRNVPATWGRRLLVLGGSLGAQSLNEALPGALYQLRNQLEGWSILHQSGETALRSTRALYAALRIEADVTPFIDHLPEVLRQTGLAVCRAGGTTLAELAATGVPAVLVPYPFAKDDHQRRNAEVYAAAGACQVVEPRASPPRFQAQLVECLGHALTCGEARERMSSAMLQLARPDAAWQIAAMLGSLIAASRTRAA